VSVERLISAPVFIRSSAISKAPICAAKYKGVGPCGDASWFTLLTLSIVFTLVMSLPNIAWCNGGMLSSTNIACNGGNSRCIV